MDMPTILAILTFGSMMLFFFGLERWLNAGRAAVDDRLGRYATRSGPSIDDQVIAEQENSNKNARRILSTARNTQNLAIELQRADLKLTPSEFILITIGLVIGGIALGFFLGRGNLLFGLIGGIAGYYLPKFQIKRLQAKRLADFNGQLGDTLIMLSNSLRSGYSLLQSMEAVSKELPAPMSIEFARVVREIGLGLSVEESLAHLLQRIKSDDLDLVVTAINIQHEVGGNLAEILDTIANTIRERVRIKGQIRAMTAQQKASGTLVSILPVAVSLFLFVMNPKYLGNLFEDVCGWVMLGVSGVMIIAGYLIIQRIVDIEV
jgi:tight adherence protein B